MQSSIDAFDDSLQGRLNRAIVDRQLFSYKYCQGFKLRKFGSKCCLCCRVKRNREDWLQKDAKEKLNLEIDILDIVKRLRVH